MRTRLHRNQLGSNQYITRRGRQSSVKGLLAFTALIAGLSISVPLAPDYTKALASPLPTGKGSVTVSITPTTTPTPVVNIGPEYDEIKAYIYEVFGKDADKAMKVLSCENARLNPEAVNTAGNEPAGSRDIGVFQINEYWQGVNGKFLFNWKINVQIAHQIFTDNGNSFERWTCGRKFDL